MRLDYVLSDEESTGGDLRTASPAILRYRCFPGDIVWHAGDVDLSTSLGWVPVLDFAVALRSIAEKLASEAHQVFEFTESDEKIEFTRAGDVVRVQTEYAHEPAEVPYEEFARAADAFLTKVVEDLTASHPELAENEFVAELAAAP